MSAGRARTRRRPAPARARPRPRAAGSVDAPCRSAAPSSSARVRHSSTVPPPKSASPSASSPVRSAWPAAVLRSNSSSQPACLSTQASISKRQRPDRVHLEGAREAVVAERRQRRLAPAAARPARADDGAQRLVTVAHDRRRDVDAIADARLRRPAPAVDLRRDVRDGDPLGRHLRYTVNSRPCSWSGHWACSSTRRRSRADGSAPTPTPSSTGWRRPARAGGRCYR